MRGGTRGCMHGSPPAGPPLKVRCPSAREDAAGSPQAAQGARLAAQGKPSFQSVQSLQSFQSFQSSSEEGGAEEPSFQSFQSVPRFQLPLLVEAIAPCIALKCPATSAWILVWLVFGFRGGVYGGPVGSQRGQGIVSSAGISFRPGRIVGEVVGVIRFLVG